MKIKYNWYPDTGIAACRIYYKGNQFCGSASCCPEDKDFQNEKTGIIIAETRATISMYKHIIKNEIKPALTQLIHLEDSMKRSKFYNEKSYESNMLRRQIQYLQNYLCTVNNEIDMLYQYLNGFIEEKDKFYQLVRANRQKDESK